MNDAHSRIPLDLLPRRYRSLLLLLALTGLGGDWCLAQSASETTDTIRGVVINSVTHEPIARALVSSPDNRFATLTNSEGRFEFTFAKAEPAGDTGPTSSRPISGRLQPSVSNRPYMLMARKPGFSPDPYNRGQTLQNGATQDVTLTLIPESLIVGAVTLPTSEAPDSIGLQLFRRRVQDGRARWTQAGGTQSTSDGQFRVADLQAGTYKLLTQELMDEDPLTLGPRAANRLAPDASGPLFGYPPVYYQNASDFGSARSIQLAAAQTETLNLSLVKQPYYRVSVPVIASGGDAPQNGVRVKVYAHDRGPGFSLGYNNQHHAIEGMLPNGSYTIEAASYGTEGMNGNGVQFITIKGAPIEGPSMVLAPNGSIAVIVKEEFTSPDQTGPMTFRTNNRTTVVKGPRRYLNVNLESADDFGWAAGASLRSPTSDESLTIDGASPGSYWVQVNSSRGYAASVRSGNFDLLHQPLVVGVGGATSPIEITMRDDVSEISGTVAGLAPPAQGTVDAASYAAESRPKAQVYCVPLADSAGQFAMIAAHPDGTFDFASLAPGEYRLLAFDRDQPELEYRNPEAMQSYNSKGPVVRVAGGQKERVTLQLITTEHI